MASIATVVTMGFGSFGSVNLLPTIGYGAGSAAALSVAGIEFAVPINRLHAIAPVNRLHFSVPQNHLHAQVPDEDSTTA